MDNKFKCYWIFQDNTYHLTNDITHLQFLIDNNLIDILTEQRNNLTWSSEQQKNIYYNDFPYIALMCGYVRILIFNDEMNIEYYDSIGVDTMEVIRSIIKQQKKTFRRFIIDNNKGYVKCFYDFKELINAL